MSLVPCEPGCPGARGRASSSSVGEAQGKGSAAGRAPAVAFPRACAGVLKAVLAPSRGA